MKHKERLLKIGIALLATVLTIFLVPWNILGLWLSPLPKSVHAQASGAVGWGLDGVIVYVDVGRKGPRLYTSGWKDFGHTVPADPNALFKIASISKLYMAAAAAKMVDRKVLSLEATLKDYLPELAGRIAYADQITLEMLLQHRSGIPDFMDSDQMTWSDLPGDADEFLDLVLDRPADFSPNERYGYCNTNYLLIGKIMDRVLGYGHQVLIKREILDPLQLRDTFGQLRGVDMDRLMSGRFTGYDGELKTQDFVVPGGSMVATASDVGIFLRALGNGSILSPREQAIYSSYAGFRHTGLLPGYSSVASYHKDIDAVVVLFANTSGGDSWTVTEMVHKRIVKILREERAQ